MTASAAPRSVELVDAARRRLGSARLRAISHGLIVVGILYAAVAFAVVLANPTGAIDAYSYWSTNLSDPYAEGTWYHYAPVFLPFVALGQELPFGGFLAIWTALELTAVAWLAGPVLLMPAILFTPTMWELRAGNVHLLIAAASVLGFRYPAAWAFVILTKLTPGLGLLWFAFRREWRSLAIAVGFTLVVAAVGFVLAPASWTDWVRHLTSLSNYGGGGDSVPIPFAARAAAAVLLLAWGARGNRRWTVPVATMLALPALWLTALSMLVAAVPLVVHRPGWSELGALLRRDAATGRSPATAPRVAGEQR